MKVSDEMFKSARAAFGAAYGTDAGLRAVFALLPETDMNNELRIDYYRSGYSCGYGDKQSGVYFRDLEAAKAFFGLTEPTPAASVPQDTQDTDPCTAAQATQNAEPTITLTEHKTKMREYVEKVLENLSVEIYEPHEGYSIPQLRIQFNGKTIGCEKDDDKAWAAAYAFTKQREQEIAEVEEEIHLLNGWRYVREYISPPATRILESREAALAELKRGLREVW